MTDDAVRQPACGHSLSFNLSSELWCQQKCLVQRATAPWICSSFFFFFSKIHRWIRGKRNGRVAEITFHPCNARLERALLPSDWLIRCLQEQAVEQV